YYTALSTAQQVADTMVVAINTNPTLVNVSAADSANGAQGVSNPSINVINLFNVAEVTIPSAANYNRLTVTAAASSITESGSTTITITREGDLTNPLSATLTAYDVDSNFSPATDVTLTGIGGDLVGSTLTIPAGQASVQVQVSGTKQTLSGLLAGLFPSDPSDEVADGTHTVKLIATAPSYNSVSATLDVTDDPAVYPELAVTLASNTAVQNVPTPITGTVYLNTGPLNPAVYPSGLTINLQSLNAGAAIVTPSTITIPADGSTVSVNFTVTPVDNGVVGHPGGLQTADIVATATGFLSGNAALTVTDNPNPPASDRQFGTTSWTPEGPAPITGGQSQTAPQAPGEASDDAAGAVEVVLPDPNNANVVYIGAVNGGVWETTNYNPNPSATTAPTWTPLTDNLPAVTVSGNQRLPSQSIGSLQFAINTKTNDLSVDANSNPTLIAGIGRFSSFGFAGGFLSGLIRSTDGGQTWTDISPTILQGLNISGAAERDNPTTLMTTLLAGANGFSAPNYLGSFASPGGLYMATVKTSTLTTAPVVTPTFASVLEPTGLPFGNVTDVVGDPGDPNRFYVASLDNEPSGSGKNNGGIFTTDDGGKTWINITPANLTMQTTGNDFDDNVRFAVHYNAVDQTNAVYFGYVENGQLADLYRANGPDFTATPNTWNPTAPNTWQLMATPSTNENGIPIGLQPDDGVSPIPGSQGIIHFSITADPTNPELVYVGGDRQPGPGDPGIFQFPNSIGATNYTGRLFRGDASQPLASQWTPITNDATASNTGPHADSRHLAFDASGNLLEVDDGGVYRLTNPSVTSATSTTQGDWYSMIGNLQVSESHNVAFDTLTNTVLAGNQDTGTPEQTAPNNVVWTEPPANEGDGGSVNVDNSSPVQSIRYTSADLSSNMFPGDLTATTYNAAGQVTNVTFP
ncbi:MAG: hypothetical protein ACREHD_16630, partial [Pirellulales bacterium]